MQRGHRAADILFRLSETIRMGFQLVSQRQYAKRDRAIDRALVPSYLNVRSRFLAQKGTATRDPRRLRETAVSHFKAGQIPCCRNPNGEERG